MSEPNPYQSPDSQRPVKPSLVKRGVGLTFILLLTPVATAITFLASCSAAVLIGLSAPAPPAWMDTVCGIIAYGPPAAVLIGMLGWIVWAAWQTRRPVRRGSPDPAIPPDQKSP